MTPRIVDVVARIELLSRGQQLSVSRNGMAEVHTLRPPQRFTPASLASIVDGPLPQDLAVLWRSVGELRLYEDTDYGQWGLVIHSPTDATTLHHHECRHRPESFTRGDFVIGEFLGDSERLMVRCDIESVDFGTVIVTLPIYRRSKWYVVAPTLSEFLEHYVDAGGKKYWENAPGS